MLSCRWDWYCGIRDSDEMFERTCQAARQSGRWIRGWLFLAASQEHMSNRDVWKTQLKPGVRTVKQRWKCGLFLKERAVCNVDDEVYWHNFERCSIHLIIGVVGI